MNSFVSLFLSLVFLLCLRSSPHHPRYRRPFPSSSAGGEEEAARNGRRARCEADGVEGEAGRARAERNLGQRRGAGVGKGRDGEMEKKARESGGVTGGGREKMLMKAATKGEGGTEGGGQ